MVLYGTWNLWKIHMLKTLHRQAREALMTTMSELEALQRISAYISKNKMNLALEAEGNMVVEDDKLQIPEEVILAIDPKPPDKAKLTGEDVDKQHFDCIYDVEPLGFEKDPMAPEKMQPQGMSSG